MKSILSYIVEASTKGTFYDAIKDNIVNFSFERSIGPTNFKDLMEFIKDTKSKFKTPSLVSISGKKANPAVLGDLFASLASQVKIDYDLDVEERIEKACDEIQSYINKNYGGDGKLIVFADVNPLSFRRNRDGSKSATLNKKIGMTIHISYEDRTGVMYININPDAKIFK